MGLGSVFCGGAASFWVTAFCGGAASFLGYGFSWGCCFLLGLRLFVGVLPPFGGTASGGSLFCSYRKVTKRYAKGTPLGTPGLANSLRLEQSEPEVVLFVLAMIAFHYGLIRFHYGLYR